MHRTPLPLRLLPAAALFVAASSAQALPANDPGRVDTADEVAVADAGHSAFGRSLPGADLDNWRRMFAGKRVFVRTWRPADGLGPRYDADSCAACHFKDGRGGRPQTPQPPPPLIFRLDDRPDAGHGFGAQLQAHAVEGLPEGRVSVERVARAGRYADGTPYRLHEPRYSVSEETARRPRLSPRQPPTLIGVGLLEAVAETTILAWADPEDIDADGISGRARWVMDADDGRRLGRFGWKAAQPSLATQTAGALEEDMGIAVEGPGAEIAREDFELLVDYLRLLAPPARRSGESPAVLARGERLFATIGCAACHRPRLVTAGAEAIDGPAALAGKTIRPYTDLLLHDLGPALADDGIGEDGAEAGEWRTAPLWGLGLLETVNGGLFLLHDGRARTFEEAILWHGGEAAAAQRRFLALDRPDRAALIAFLKSI